jgi:hypothetical protein
VPFSLDREARVAAYLLEVIVVGLVVVGCGGAGVATRSTATQVSGSSTASAPTASGSFCELYVGNYKDISGVGVGIDSDAQRQSSERVRPVLDALDHSAPSEIRGDVLVVTQDLRSMHSVLAKYGYDSDRALREATEDERKVLLGPGPLDALGRVERYVRSHCAGATTLPNPTPYG